MVNASGEPLGSEFRKLPANFLQLPSEACHPDLLSLLNRHLHDVRKNLNSGWEADQSRWRTSSE